VGTVPNPRDLDWGCNEVGGGGLHASYLIRRIVLVVYFHHVLISAIGLKYGLNE
jgi:hypothetical protein